MAITRSSSGLLERDEFGSDTSANYSLLAGRSLTIDSGEVTCTANTNVVRATFDTVGVVTVRAKRSGTRMSGPMITDKATMTSAGNNDSYTIRVGTNWLMSIWNDGSNTDLANGSSSNVPADGAYGIARIWQAGGVVYGRAGTTSLASAFQNNEATYTCARGGMLFCNQAANNVDWVELRTSISVTCSGLPADWQFQVTDGTTTVKATAVAGTATVNASSVMWPFTEVMVLDAANAEQMHLLAATLADMGGGDAFAYAADASYIPGIMQAHIFPSQIGG